MKNKIVMITALLAVMAAMTGIAAATTTTSPSDVDIDIAGLNPATIVTIKFDLYTMSSSESLGGLQFDFNDYSTDSPTAEVTGSFDGISYSGFHGVSNTWTIEDGHWAVWKVYVKDAADGDDATQNGHAYFLDFKVKKNNGGTIETNRQIGSATTIGHATIPEFATIAMPIAAVLGLVFFFQQRKNKEE